MDLTRVRAYYDETWRHYRLLWLTSATPGIHFGYWDAQTKRYEEALLDITVKVSPSWRPFTASP
jgi:hypothetical protein